MPNQRHPSYFYYIMHAKLWLREAFKGVNMGQNRVCDGLIQKITSGIVSTGQKTIPDTPIMPDIKHARLWIRDSKSTSRGVKGVKIGSKWGL